MYDVEAPVVSPVKNPETPSSFAPISGAVTNAAAPSAQPLIAVCAPDENPATASFGLRPAKFESRLG